MQDEGAFRLALVGATGAVGETMLRVLEERHISTYVSAFASRDHDTPLHFHGRTLPVARATPDALAGHDVVMFAGGDDVSTQFAPACAERGATVIDNSPTFRMDDDVPLVVPEINAAIVRADQRIFAVANCTAILLAMALWPIARVAGLRSARVASYQAVSGAGKVGIDELTAAEHALQTGTPEPPPRAFTAPIAHNVIPQVGGFDEAGDTCEERKVAAETKKILALPSLHVAATAVRVPVRTAHSEAVFVETAEDTTVADLAAAFRTAPGIVFHRHGIVTPRDVEGTDDVHVARLRSEGTSKRHFQLWLVGDQLRKGAATNAVQILELLLERGFLRAAPLQRA